MKGISIVKMDNPKITKASVRYSQPVIPTEYLQAFGFVPNDEGVWNYELLFRNWLRQQGIKPHDKKTPDFKDTWAVYRGFDMQGYSGDAPYFATVAVMAPEAALRHSRWTNEAAYVAAKFLNAWIDVPKDTYVQGFSVQLDRIPSPKETDDVIRALENALNDSRLFGKVEALPASIDRSVVAFVSPKLAEMLRQTPDLNWRMRNDVATEYGLRENKVQVL